MVFFKKHKKICVIAAALFLFLLFLPEKANKYDFGIAFITEERMLTADSERLTEAISEALKEISGYEEASISVEEIDTQPDEGSGRQNALSRLLYGDGVIYVADYELVRSIIDDDELFAVLPNELEADIFCESGFAVAKSLKSFSGLDFQGEYDDLCIFIRSDIAEDKALSEYLKNNYEAACKALMKIK